MGNTDENVNAAITEITRIAKQAERSIKIGGVLAAVLLISLIVLAIGFIVAIITALV